MHLAPGTDAVAAQELIDVTQQLLECIAAADWQTYTKLCDESLTAREPEGLGQLIVGMPFHRYYFDLGGSSQAVNVSIVSPHVRITGAVGVITYVRLVQKLTADGAPITVAGEETRVWERHPEGWKHVHFHRSPLPG